MIFTLSKPSDLLLDTALSREWLETNGLGSYASSSLMNCHTRKYHGLLVSQCEKTGTNNVLLSKIEDVILEKDRQYILSACQYPCFLQDGSFSFYHQFFLDTHPCFCYQFDQVLVSKEILMPADENTVLIKYCIKNSSTATIKIKPLLAFRNVHSLTHENNSIASTHRECHNGLAFSLDQDGQDGPTLFFQMSSHFRYTPDPVWYKNVEYLEELNRGYDFREDLFSPGEFHLTSQNEGNSQTIIIFSCSLTEEKTNLVEKWNQEISRRKNLIKTSGSSTLQKQLSQVSQSFIRKTMTQKARSVIAGYHWFGEFGRDAMIALPGLTLYNGFENKCLDILIHFKKQMKQGLIPNLLGKSPKEHSYNSVDTSLWFIWAVQQYYLKTDDLASVKNHLWTASKEIFLNYQSGTLFNIKMGEDGLIYAGNETTNLTWMDAIINGIPVTPRYGAAVEINALWFNTLNFMYEMAQKLDDELSSVLKPLITQVKKSFRALFWNEERGYLNDYVCEEKTSFSIRPNQLFAVSLPYSPLTKKMSKKVLTIIKTELLTPYGLRSLSPRDPDYIGVYQGNTTERDKSYHNGTVWPWLLGNFAEAWVKTYSNLDKVVAILKPTLISFEQHLSEAGIGTISEIFDGDFPHQPRGCISQAWSVAEILRMSYILQANRMQ